MIEDIKKACQVYQIPRHLRNIPDIEIHFYGRIHQHQHRFAVLTLLYFIYTAHRIFVGSVTTNTPNGIGGVQNHPAFPHYLADKPLTIIYSGARNLAANLLAEDGSVGIRVTNEDFSKRLCQQFRKAIVSTSANISGQPSPKNFSEISEEVKSAVDYIVGYRQEEMSNPKPSSIIKLDKGGVIKIIRE